MDGQNIIESMHIGPVRVIESDGKRWFVAKDVVKGLGYRWSNTSIFQTVPEEWKRILRVNTPGGPQKALVLSEQGLYFFLLRSDKPQVFPCQKRLVEWITRPKEDITVNELKIFEKAEFGQVRVVERDGEPWFVAKDVCRVLGIVNDRDALSGLDDDEKADVGITDTSSNGVTQTRTVNIISESSLYALVFRSRKPEAKAFSKWVRAEVLPSIRKTGSYSIRQDVPPVHSLPREIGETFSTLFTIASHIFDKNQAALCANTGVRNIHNVNPMELMGITSLEAPEEHQQHYFTATEIGKNFLNGASAVRINKMLCEKGLQTASRDRHNRVIYNLTDTGRQYSRIFDTGRVHSTGAPVQQIRWSSTVADLLQQHNTQEEHA